METDTKITVKLGDSIDTENQNPCKLCNRRTQHKVLSDFHLTGIEDAGNEFIFGWNNRYKIIQCLGCHTIQFLLESSDSESVIQSVGPQGYEDEYIISKQYFPDTEDSRSEIDNAYCLPYDLQKIYQETIKALNINTPILVGVGIRAIVETVCNDKNAEGNNLAEKIDKLVPMGVLTKDNTDILHKIRSLGNESAHKVKPHKKATLNLALDVIENVLRSVYIIPELAKKLQ